MNFELKGRAMDKYKILFDEKNNTITIRYGNTVKYKALLNSLKDLLTVYMPKDVHVLLDFSKIEYLKVSYHQVSNFRDGLKMLFPKKKVSKISIINFPGNSYASVICASTPSTESEFVERSLHCCENDQKPESYQ